MKIKNICFPEISLLKKFHYAKTYQSTPNKRRFFLVWKARKTISSKEEGQEYARSRSSFNILLSLVSVFIHFFLTTNYSPLFCFCNKFFLDNLINIYNVHRKTYNIIFDIRIAFYLFQVNLTHRTLSIVNHHQVVRNVNLVIRLVTISFPAGWLNYQKPFYHYRCRNNQEAK